MTDHDPRMALDRLVRERRDDYAALSRLLGRNAAYIQQYIKRGTPRRLAEDDRRRLAEYFGVDEAVLGGPATPAGARGFGSMVAVPRLDVRASAGPGALGSTEYVVSHVAFDRKWLRQLCAAKPDDLSIVLVQGDSMSPTLADGDDIMVDRGDGAERLRDGIYVLLREDELVVKRLAVNPANGRITLKSDNPAYPEWPDCDPAAIAIAGRVVWTGRRVG
jgi:phage repressor protein C with HTH and peptisase S24 domain